jgi:hypothetical protein
MGWKFAFGENIISMGIEFDTLVEIILSKNVRWTGLNVASILSFPPNISGHTDLLIFLQIVAE